MSKYRYRVSLFYSYCHKDTRFMKEMEDALGLLRTNNLLTDWHDRKILPGTKWNSRIETKLKQAEIVAFLVSTDFLNSSACRKEWEIGRRTAEETGQILIPIIIRDCPWEDFDNMAEYQALPEGVVPINQWEDEDAAWKHIYEKIRVVLENVRQTFEVREQYKREISRVEFISQSQENIDLDSLFVFPNLSLEDRQPLNSPNQRVLNFDNLLELECAIIRGIELSGKSTLCRKLFLHLSENRQPALLLDLNEINTRNPRPSLIYETYSKQMKGDYNLWSRSENKTIIIDNLSPEKINFLEFIQDHFQKVFVTTTTDNYLAYFTKDSRLSKFKRIEILQLGHSLQERIIRRWATLDPSAKTFNDRLPDGKVDQLERIVNSIFFGKVIPRYPFFILSILQTHEARLNYDLNISAYGHCYQALITAHIFNSRIANDQIDSCFNYLGRLAYEIHLSKNRGNTISAKEFHAFESKYSGDFIDLWDSTRRRLFNLPNSILIERNDQISFSWPYSYYFFLGRYLAGNHNENEDLLEDILKNSYTKDNSLTLVFVIHHSHNPEIIDNILIHTLDAIKWRQPANLDLEEISLFEDVLMSLTIDHTSENSSVPENRKEERDARDHGDILETESYDNVKESPYEAINDIYKALKNMDILSQILKNKHGSIEKGRLFDIVETIVDTGLKLANLVLLEQSELDELAQFIIESEELNANGVLVDKETIKIYLIRTVFGLVMNSIEKAVSSINSREVSQIVLDLCKEKNTPAYDLVYNFYSIDIADNLTNDQLKLVKETLKKHRKNYLVARSLPIRVERYLATHRAKDSIRSAFRSLFRLTTQGSSG